MLVCPSCGEENPDRFRLCGFCGTELVQPPPEEVRKTVTVMFAGVAGAAGLRERAPEVFISYSRTDHGFVRELYEALLGAGYDVWVDWEDIAPSSDWREQIHRSIEAAATVVCVLSPEWATSPICQEEVAAAATHAKRIIPLLHRDVDPAQVAAPAAQRNWIFCRSGQLEQALPTLLTALKGDRDWTTELDPEAVRGVLSRYGEVVRGAVAAHGGVVQALVGQSVMAVFGVPTLHEDDPLRAVRAAQQVRQDLEPLNTELLGRSGVRLHPRIGIFTGEVLTTEATGDAPSPVSGTTVDLAARLEQRAAAGEILIGEPTFRFVRDAVEVEPGAPVRDSSGAQTPVHRVVSVAADRAGRSRHLETPLVGRQEELGQLLHTLDTTISSRTPHLVTVVGAAGVGKSRLVGEFLAEASDRATVATGRCLSYGEGITFFPLAEAIRGLAAIDQDQSRDQARHRLLGLAASVPEGATVAERVAHLCGLSDVAAPAEELSWAVRRLFETLARDRPLVLVLDDIQWAEPALLDLIEQLVDWSTGAPLLVLAMARPELLETRPGWGTGRANASQVVLEPLPASAADALVEAILGPSDLPAELRDRIFSAADGNPLFVEEMLGMLTDEGLLRLEEGRWVAAEAVALVSVPPTIGLLLNARLDRLGEQERAVVESASVEGQVFHHSSASALAASRAKGAVGSPLLSLTRKDLIRPTRGDFGTEDAFRFRHLLIRDVAYQRLPKRSRAELHRRFASWLEERVGERIAEFEEIVGYHYEQAYRLAAELGQVDEDARQAARSAAAHLGAAGRRAIGRRDVRAAVSLLRGAADVLAVAPEERLQLLPDLALAYSEGGNLAEAARTLREAEATARVRGDEHITARLAVVAPDVAFRTGDNWTAEAHTRAQEAIDRLEALGDHAWVAIGCQKLVAFAPREARVRELVVRGVANARIAGETGREASLLSVGCSTGVLLSTPSSVAVREAEGVLERVKTFPLAEANTLGHLSFLYALRQRFDEARTSAARARNLYESLAEGVSAACMIGQNLADAEMMAGEFAAAEVAAMSGRQVLAALDERGYLATIDAGLAEALYAQDRHDDALVFAESSRDNAPDADLEAECQLPCAMAKLVARGGDPAAGEQMARAAVELAAPTDFLYIRGNTWMSLAEVLRLAGRGEEANAALREALAIYERHENLPMIERVRSLLSDADVERPA